MNYSNALLLDSSDNVAVALIDLKPGEEVQIGTEKIQLLDFIPAKHKFSLQDLEAGNDIFMYGTIVAEVTQKIKKGAALTLMNIQHKTSTYQLPAASNLKKEVNTEEWQGKSFLGYHRSDGQVGTANYWLVLPLVFCENTNIKLLQEAFENALGFGVPNPYEQQINQLLAGNGEAMPFANQAPSTLRKQVFSNVDGIRFLTHSLGCGGTRDDASSLCGLLAGYIHHPNVAGATVLSLGCQNAQVALLQEKLAALACKKPVFICEQQQEGTTHALLSKAVVKTMEGLKLANEYERKPAPLNKLVIGLECGGSDGFSGISANPTLGYVSDQVVALGGTAILAEFPELCGAEQDLLNRCQTKEIAGRFIQLMETYHASARRVGSGFDKNPSPGNIKDGLLTDGIKSCGAAKKGGTSPISDVLDYPEYIKKSGLNLLCTPGNDVESTTALAGSGANLILFTTGLGTPTGNPISPVIKVSSNTTLSQRMPDIIDFNAGTIISGEDSLHSAGEKLMELLVEVASGTIQTKADLNRNFDFIPWKRGVSL